MLCCPPLSVLYFSGLLPHPILRLKDGNSMMYEVFLGDFLPKELGTLLHRTEKYSPLSQNNVPLCKKKLLQKQKERKGGRGKTERDRERKNYKQEKLLGQNSKGRNLQTRYSESFSRVKEVCASTSCSKMLHLLPKCTENISGLGSVSPTNLYDSFSCCPSLQPTRVNVQDLIALGFRILATPFLLLGGHKSLPASVFQVFVEVRETGGEKHFSHVVIFAI